MKLAILAFTLALVWCGCTLRNADAYAASSRLTLSRNRLAAGLTPPGEDFPVGSSSRRRRSSFPSKPHSRTKNVLLSVLSGCLQVTCDAVTNLFPLWVLGATIMGYFRPEGFKSYMHLVSPALALTMGFMGLTLTGNDFVRVLKEPQYVLLGMASQFTIMPLLAATMAKTQQLPSELSAGLILVGCAPGGTASNLVTLIAKADVALSVTMTAFSTVAASLMTPFLTARLASQYVAINQGELVKATINVVLAPVMGGLLINKALPNTSKQISRFTPSFSVLLVAFICGTISAVNAASLPKQAIALINSGVSFQTIKELIKLINKNLFIGIVGLHAGGFVLGYVVPKLGRAGEKKSRAISIETGMQNSALAAVLAQALPNPSQSALPACISATTHSVLGSLLAGIWRISDYINRDKKFLNRYALSPSL